MNYEEFQRLLHETDLEESDDRCSNVYNNKNYTISKSSTTDNINSFLDDVQKRYQSLIEDLDTINVLFIYNLLFFIRNHQMKKKSMMIIYTINQILQKKILHIN